MPRNDGTLTFVRPGKALFGEVSAGYLVTVVRGGRERPLVWRPPEPLPLDLREEWEMHWAPEGMSARQFSGRGEQRRPRQIVPIPDRAIDTGAAVALFGSPDNDRPDFAVRVQRLRPILPPTKRPAADVGAHGVLQAYLYSGAGDAVTDAVPVTNQFSVVVDDRRAVEFIGQGRAATLLASLPGFHCRLGNAPPQELVPNVPLEVDVTAGEFLEIRSGKLWWHLTTVASPDPFVLGPDDAPPPDVQREENRLRALVSATFVGSLLAVVGVLLWAPPAPKTPIVPATAAELKLKAPKRVAPAAPIPVPELAATAATKEVQEPRATPAPLTVEVTRPPAERWNGKPREPEAAPVPVPERADVPSLAETINRAAELGRPSGAGGSAAGGGIDPRVRSPRQERRRREVAEQGPLRLTVSGTGHVERADVEAALERHLGEFQRCYVNALERNPQARGIAQFEWTISRTGMVSDVVVLRSEVGDDTMLRCLEEEVRRVRFPQPVDGAVRVRYPFVFRALGD